MTTKKQRLENIISLIKQYGGTEATALQVYTEVFKLGEGVLERSTDTENGDFKTNPIGYGYNIHKNEQGAWEREKGEHIILYEDTFAKSLKKLQKYDFAIIGGLSYFGWRNYLKNANKMHALILDLDGINEKTMFNFLGGCNAGLYPLPNYMVLSGTNCHLYYTFEEAVPLYPDIKLALKELKHELIAWIWNKNTSTQEPQFQGINQGFRVIGGKTKRNSATRRVLAYKLNNHPYDLATLNNFVPSAKQVDDKKLFRIGKTTLSEARKKWPLWYEWMRKKSQGYPGRLIDLSKQPGHKGNELYLWWLRKLQNSEAIYGSRYFAIMSLVIFAVKCNVSYERVKSDSYSLIEVMTNINPAEPFTEDDITSALECYDENYATFPRRDIEKISHIAIPPNKRNKLKQAEHLEIARHIKEVKKRAGKVEEGRPLGSGTKKKLVSDYIKMHSEESVTEIAKALKVSRHTVYKYKNKGVKKE